MQRTACGEESAFEILIERHQSLVIGTIAKMLGDASTAEDLAQQVFIRVWQSAPRYEASAKFTTWLLTITRNLVFNETRRRGRARLLPMEYDDGTPREFKDASSPQPSMLLQSKELRTAIDEAIASLPEQQRLALILRRYEDMPYEDIAAVLKTTVPSVKSLLFRAREALRSQLERFLSL
ncbi:MAG: sigma-70 family RNA polymerase sigma factor [bacterium]